MLVTHVQAVGPFLRIFGQLDLERMQQIQLAINMTMNIVNQLQVAAAPEMSELPVETICLARFLGTQYRRARIIGHWGHSGVFVQFIDYGNECNVKLQEIRLLNFQTPEVDLLQSVPTQATPFILSGIYCQWTLNQMNELNADLGGQYVTTVTDAQLGEFIFISIIWRNENLVNYLVHIKNIGTMISLEEQTSIFNTILSKSDRLVKKSSNLTANNTNSIKATSRGLVPVRQLHSALPTPQYNMPQISHTLSSAVPIQASIASPMIPTPSVIRMPYKNNMISSNGRHEVTMITSPRQRNDMITIPSPPKRSVLTFKSNTLMVGTSYDVYCCFVENGPCLFTVHLRSTADELNELMNEIDSIKLSNLTERPSIGMACIAKYSEDNHLYRAVIMTIKPTACQVAYVDYGNTETVPFADIYEIPPSLLDQKIFAIRFALSGYKELEPLDDVLKSAFKDMVLHKDLRLKVMPLEGPPLVQYCELFDENLNILEALKTYKNRHLAYSQPPPLSNNDLVVIRYVESPKKFFVQRVDTISGFDQMMDDLFLHCKKSPTALQKFTTGAACAVKFENAWYRAEILGLHENRVHIRHIDFGNERYVDGGQLCAISEKLVKFPIQASKCCLKGFENTESLSESATVQLEMLAENANNERRHFKCQIYQIEKNDTFLVNLIDDKIRPELNLMKRLYKLSMPFNTYIGLEKEEYPYQENSQPGKPGTQYNPVSPGFDSNQLNNEDQYNANELSGDWNVKSSNSIHSDDSKEYSNSSEKGGRNQNHFNSGSQRPFKENNNRREPKEQPFKTFGGKNTDLPPRFQRNQDENRRFKENRESGSYDQKRNNYNSGSYNSAPANPPQQIFNQPVQCDDEWDSNPTSTAPAPLPKSTASSFANTREEYVPLDFTYSHSDVLVPSREEIILCWWVSPHQFYTHNCASVSKFEVIMRDVQLFYKNKSPATNRSLDVGASVIARYQKDQVLYRATILAHNESLRKYRVQLVDFGNQATVTANDIWLLEKRFSQFPIMANLCGFENIVSNFEHREITSQVEKYLKPGLKLHCNYLRRENKMYFADIDVDGVSLKDLLIQDGSLTIVQPNVNLEMLSGQQIRIKIVNVKDLLNFQIEIESCDLRLMSSYNDIKFVRSNPHLSTEFRNNYEGKCCIADVIDVSKEKILMLQPIIPLFVSNVSQKICEYPIVYRDFNVKVAFIETENIIYVHPVMIEEELAGLLDSMYSFYSSEGSPMSDYTPGTLCATLSSDRNWYRAKIVFFDSSQSSVEVYYLDYGNIEVVEDLDNLRTLEKQFCESSALAVRIIFPIKCENSDETATETIKTLIDGYELTVIILERYKHRWIADIQSNGHSLINVLKDSYSLTNGVDVEHAKNLIDNDTSCTDILPPSPDFSANTHAFEPQFASAASSAVEITHSDSQRIALEISKEPLETATSSMISAYLSHCDNPGRFFLHLTSTYTELQQLQDNIQIVAGSLPPLMTAVTGALCIALYTVDETWYRAKIIDSEIMAVQFIDYGNTDVLTDSSYVKEMNEAFANIPPFAISCALPISPRNTTDWVDEANVIFNEAYDKTVFFSYVTQNPKKNYVNLKIDELNVAEKLIADGLARKLEVLKSGESGFVSHINSLSDFYIQMESYADGLELIAGHLADYENFQVLTDFSIGNICAAVFPEDSSWYRAKILSHDAEGTEVLFIDFGNTAVTTELREISAEIANLPFLSKKCSLRMPDYILGWSDEAEAKFHELSAMGETVFVVELIEPSDHAIIDLYIEDKNILEDLEPLCDKRPNIEMDLNSSMGKDDFALHEHVTELKLEDVIVSHVNTPTDFYIQLSLESDQLDQVLEALSAGEQGEALVKPEVGTICNAVFSDDGGFYRAEILSNDTKDGCDVIFIDYGNTATINELYRLPNGWNTKPALAHQCTLDPNGPLDLNSSSTIDDFLQITTGDEASIFKVDIIDRSVQPWKVSLQCGRKNVYEELERLQAERANGVNGSSSVAVVNEVVDEIIENSIRNVANEETSKEKLISDVVDDIIDESISQRDEVVCEQITISHMNSPTDFYVQFISEKDKLDQVLETLNSAELSSALDEPQVGMLCNAFFKDDEAFYRAEVLSSQENESFRVLFIDYGNEAVTNELYSLPASLNTLPSLAYHCTLDASGSLDLSDLSVVDDFLQIMNGYQNEQNAVLEAIISNRCKKPWTVSLNCNGVDVYQELLNRNIKTANAVFANAIVDSIIEESIGSKISESKEEEETETIGSDIVNDIIDKVINEAAAEQPQTINATDSCIMNAKNETSPEVVITQVYHQTDFYIRPCSAEQKLEEIEERLKCASEFELLHEPQTGSVCAAEHEEVYYRAKILSIEDDGQFEVELIDSGLRLRSKNLRDIDENLKNLPGLARHCRLVADEPDEKRSNIFKTFVESTPNKQYSMEVIDSHEHICTVRLSSHDMTMEEKLAAMSTVEDVIDTLLGKILKDAVVSHINSPNDFYIQLSRDTKNLESITETLQLAVNFEKVASPEVGMLCAAAFPDDGAFYRAQVLQVHDDSSYEVRFVDFGNISKTEDIRLLPDDISKKECLAKQCALENQQEVDLWSETASDSFKALITTHFGETFQVEVKSNSQTPWIVRLYRNSADLFDELKKLIEEQQSLDTSTSSDVWAEAKNSSGAIMCEEIVEDIIDELLATNAEKSAERDDSLQDKNNLNDSDSSSSETAAKNPITCDDLAKQLWDGLQKLGKSDAVGQLMGNRASSTSNLCDNKLMKNANSVTALLSGQTDPTRSKSVECVIDTN